MINKILEALQNITFTAELHDNGWDGETVNNLLCLGDVIDVIEQVSRTSEQYMKNGMERLLKDNVALINDENLQEVCCYCDDYVVEHDYSNCKDCINFKMYCELSERRQVESN